ncbi:MAG TPA: trypsin-like peptidase domain-containing protein [Blastocatellia bacterium]|nr:trypsin-like peptidase domain-containing protein [Blastocatellia bacterium]
MRPSISRTSSSIRLTLFALIALASPRNLPGQTPKGDLSPEVRSRVRQAIAATALVLVRSSGDAGESRPRGSAVIVRSDGIAVTNLHVLVDARSGKPYDEIVLSLGPDESNQHAVRYKAVVLLIDRESDLALLRIDNTSGEGSQSRKLVMPTVEMGDSDNIKLLDDIFIIGYPEKGGVTVTVNRGVVEGKDALLNWIKTDARLIHGNSGGAAVDSAGRLIGIPTKVVADVQPIDRDGDGFPDDYRRFGAVGFLRPSRLVAVMLDRLGREQDQTPLSVPTTPKEIESPVTVTVRGTVRSSVNKKPVAGALVGLVIAGAKVSESTLLTWGSTNAEGEFVLNKPVPPGRYTLKAKAPGLKVYTGEVEIKSPAAPLTIEM